MQWTFLSLDLRFSTINNVGHHFTPLSLKHFPLRPPGHRNPLVVPCSRVGFRFLAGLSSALQGLDQAPLLELTDSHGDLIQSCDFTYLQYPKCVSPTSVSPPSSESYIQLPARYLQM